MPASRIAQVSAAAAVIIVVGAGCALRKQTPVPAAIAPGDHRMTVTVGSVTREYVVHVPAGYDGSKPVAVVIMFHGGGGTAENTMTQTNWNGKADAEGFLVAYPEGTRPDPSRPASFATNPQTWNVGSGEYAAGRQNVDDVGFAGALLDDLEARFSIDTTRVYVTGFSNGSGMAYRVGAELSDRVAAIAPVGSNGLRVAVDKLQKPVSLLDIQGADDPLNPLEGGHPKVAFLGDSQDKPSVRTSIAAWAKLLGCPAPSPETFSDGVHTTSYGSCDGGSTITLIVIDGAGHVWPGGVSFLPRWLVGEPTDKINATDTIWEFFKAHPQGK